jgi:hypothetical protein
VGLLQRTKTAQCGCVRLLYSVIKPKVEGYYQREDLLPFRKDPFVRRSLSVLLPVKDAQATLIDSVHEILDVVTDTKDPFEVIIIDDGSTDATGEVAHELTCHYPQVRVVRHQTPLGREASIETGLQRSQGEVVMLHDHEGGFCIIEQRSKLPKPVSSRPARPNYLSRVKSFALGE